MSNNNEEINRYFMEYINNREDDENRDDENRDDENGNDENGNDEIYESIFTSFYNNLLNNRIFNNTILNDRNIINNSLYAKSKYKNVISPDAELELKKIKYESNKNYNNSCPIYQTNFEENEDVIILPCNHCFTPDAIIKWLKEEHAICPVCRYEFKSIEIKNNEETENNYTRNQDISENEAINEYTPLLNESSNILTQILNQIRENNPNITLQSFNRPFTNIDISNGNNLINSVIRTNPNIYYNQNDSNNTFQRRLRPRYYTYINNSYMDQEEEELQQALMESLLPEYMNPQNDNNTLDLSNI